jgi:hypothetical protein
MEGYTLDELVELLGINRKAVEMRLFRKGIKPITKAAIYEKSVLDVIRSAPMGRLPKNPENKE